ncbi:MAG: Hsp20/alpha crystallin family protein [Chthonomonadales bacterium]
MSRLADETLRGFFSDSPAPNKFWQPRVDVYETPEAIVVKAEISGVKADSLNVVLGGDDRVLTISGERYEKDADRSSRIRCYQLEINFGPFERQIMLPADSRIKRDEIVATSRDGFLVITLPKRSGASSESCTIPITE